MDNISLPTKTFITISVALSVECLSTHNNCVLQQSLTHQEYFWKVFFIILTSVNTLKQLENRVKSQHCEISQIFPSISHQQELWEVSMVHRFWKLLSKRLKFTATAYYSFWTCQWVKMPSSACRRT